MRAHERHDRVSRPRQKALGRTVWYRVRPWGKKLGAHEVSGSIESVKAVSTSLPVT